MEFEIVTKKQSLVENVNNRYSYLLNRKFRTFLKLLISNIENENYEMYESGDTVKLKFTKKVLKENGLMFDKYDFEECMTYYKEGLFNIAFKEEMFVGDESIGWTNMKFVSASSIGEKVAYIHCGIGVFLDMPDRFQWLKEQIKFLESLEELKEYEEKEEGQEECFFDIDFTHNSKYHLDSKVIGWHR